VGSRAARIVLGRQQVRGGCGAGNGQLPSWLADFMPPMPLLPGATTPARSCCALTTTRFTYGSLHLALALYPCCPQYPSCHTSSHSPALTAAQAAAILGPQETLTPRTGSHTLPPSLSLLGRGWPWSAPGQRAGCRPVSCSRQGAARTSQRGCLAARAASPRKAGELKAGRPPMCPQPSPAQPWWQ
jgi:hypothetical protein